MNLPTTYKIFHRSLLVFLFLVLCGNCISQLDELHFEHLTVEDGLSHGSVRAIFQDHKGYMWFGTEYGLNQYDGYQFKVYQNDPLDSTSIDYNTINYITEDSHHRLWIGTEESLNYLNRDLNTFVRYQHNPDDANSIAKGSVNGVLEDHNGILWVSTPGMLQEFYPETGVFIKYLAKDNEGNLLGQTGALYEDSHHNLWVTTEKGVRLFDRTKKEFSNPLQDHQAFVDEQVAFYMTLIEDQKGDLWVANRGDGIRKFSYSSRTWEHYRHDEHDAQSLRSNFVNGLLEDKDGRIWISTGRSGLDYFDIASETFFHVQSNATDKSSLNAIALNTLYEDQSGGIWIGTWHGGLSYLQKDYRKFQHIKKDISGKSLSSDLVQAVVSDKDGNLWIGTEEGGGLNYYATKEKIFKTIVAPETAGNKHLGSLNIKSLLCSRSGLIWIGTMEGLDMYDPESFKWTHYRNDRNDIKSIMPGFVNSILEDAQGNIWAGISGGGLNRLDPELGTFKYFPYSSEAEGRYETITALIEDKSGIIWAGTAEDGLLSFDPNSNKFTLYDDIIADRSINCIYEDEQGLLWIGAGGSGLKSFNRITGFVSIFDQQAGLPSNYISGILADETGRFWVSTANGISCFNPREMTFQNYDVSDGLQSNQFSRNAFCKTMTGAFCFGGVNGFNLFYPDEIIRNEKPPSVVIRDFQLFNKSVQIGAKSSPLTKHIDNTESITLNHRQSVFSFEFAALNFTAPEKNQYAYMMEQYDEDWNMVGTRRFASYTNLPPGDYTFRVKASNNDNVWNEEGVSIDLKILPKPWLTWWAYTIYTILVLVLFYLFRVYELSRMKIRNELMLEKLNHQKDAEMHQLKMNFFTNISHELRSPLTLILSPLETLMSDNKTEQFVQRQYILMERNVQKLLRLINQLLDFRKVELGMLQLKAAKGDVVKYTQEVVHVFNSLASKKNIDLRFNSHQPKLESWFDWDKLEKVLFNLISNAIKFTPESGVVEISVDTMSATHNDLSEGNTSEYAVISISDTGPGIPSDKIPLIFERFYQVSPEIKTKEGGFGIGLAFAKELVEMHRGMIKIESEVGKGSVFKVMLPLGHNHLEPEEIVVFSDEGKEELVSDVMVLEGSDQIEETIKIEPKQTILIVDDDVDIRAYLNENLSDSYTILEASNGKEAWHITKDQMPAAILSDVLMPEMDGIDYCKLVKTNMDYCHIPVILLTALSAVEHRISGVEAGADVYIPKPFNLQLVKATIANQLESRKKLRQASQTNLLLSPEDYSPTSMDKDFLEKVIQIIDEHLDESDFDMNDLQKSLGMSNSSLYRKLKALTDQSINEFIRNIRLSRGSELLKQSELNISEISYMVGFTDPKYFSTCFRKRYDLTPSRFRTRIRKESKSKIRIGLQDHL